MTQQRFGVDFDPVSEMYRDLDDGQYRMGPPRDWDSEADRFRAKSGRFKRQTSYGPDDQRGSSRSMSPAPMSDPMLSDTDDRRTLGLPEVELDFGGL